MEETSQPPERVVADHFAIVPEWLLDADISDAAVRLYAVLRYGATVGARMPSRTTLATRLHKKSTDTIDRALKALAAISAVTIEHRYDGSQRLTNAYRVRTSRPDGVEPPTPTDRSSRTVPATCEKRPRSGRMDRERVAADSGHDPEHLTHRNSSTIDRHPQRKRTQPAGEEEIATACVIDDWRAFVGQTQRARRDVGESVTRWAGLCLASAPQLAVSGRGWAAGQAAAAQHRVAVDMGSRSPMRVAEAGPWWDEPPTTQQSRNAYGVDLLGRDQAFLEAGGVRIELQMQARRALEETGVQAPRDAVIRGAYRSLLNRDTVADGGTGGAA